MTAAATRPSGRLRALARRRPGSPSGPPTEEERCDLCGQPVPGQHRHIVDVPARTLLCACRPCTVLFDTGAAGGGHYRLVPDRCRSLPDLELDDATWSALGIPVDVAFFLHSTQVGRTVAIYPSPLGATESVPDAAVWAGLVARNPVLAGAQPDVEALLVRRGSSPEYYLAPVDRCYQLVGIVRRHWQGFSGGDEVWRQVDRFFAELSGRREDLRVSEPKEAR